jgi:hypothetical protein
VSYLRAQGGRGRNNHCLGRKGYGYKEPALDAGFLKGSEDNELSENTEDDLKILLRILSINLSIYPIHL